MCITNRTSCDTEAIPFVNEFGCNLSFKDFSYNNSNIIVIYELFNYRRLKETNILSIHSIHILI